MEYRTPVRYYAYMGHKELLFIMITFGLSAAHGITTHHDAPSADTDYDSKIAEFSHIVNDTPPTNHTKQSSEPIISINTDSPLDMNWSGMLTVAGTGPTPAAEQIVLPFWRNHPINNLDVRVRFFDVKF